MKNIQPEPLEPAMPEDIEMVNVDPVSGLRYGEECKTGVLMPFIKGTAPTETSACAFPTANTEQTSGNPAVDAEVKPEVKQEPEKQNWLQRMFN